MDPQICDAIENALAFNYDGLPREIEPHAHGISLADKPRLPNRRTKLKRTIGLASVGCGENGIVARMSFYLRQPPPRHQNDSGMKSVHCQL